MQRKWVVGDADPYGCITGGAVRGVLRIATPACALVRNDRGFDMGVRRVAGKERRPMGRRSVGVMFCCAEYGERGNYWFSMNSALLGP